MKKGRGLQRCRVVGRSSNNANANGGIAYAYANNASSNANSNNAARLANRMKLKKNIASTAYRHVLPDSRVREVRASVTAATAGKLKNIFEG